MFWSFVFSVRPLVTLIIQYRGGFFCAMTSIVHFFCLSVASHTFSLACERDRLVTIFLHTHTHHISLCFALCRLFLRQFAIEVLRSAFNNSIEQVRRVLGHGGGGGGAGHDDSYLLWFIRFFTEFNRLSCFQLALVR